MADGVLTLDDLRRFMAEMERRELELSPVYLPPWLYDEASRMGCDMRYYEKVQPLPRHLEG